MHVSVDCHHSFFGLPLDCQCQALVCYTWDECGAALRGHSEPVEQDWQLTVSLPDMGDSVEVTPLTPAEFDTFPLVDPAETRWLRTDEHDFGTFPIYLPGERRTIVSLDAMPENFRACLDLVDL